MTGRISHTWFVMSENIPLVTFMTQTQKHSANFVPSSINTCKLNLNIPHKLSLYTSISMFLHGTCRIWNTSWSETDQPHFSVLRRSTNTQESIPLMNDGCYSSGSIMLCFCQTLAMTRVEDLNILYINEKMKGHFIHLGIWEKQIHLIIQLMWSGLGNVVDVYNN